MDDNDPVTERNVARELQEHLDRGAEPFWMQDIRLAVKRLEAKRLASRASSRPDLSSGELIGD
jgi:hypothetical protein